MVFFRQGKRLQQAVAHAMKCPHATESDRMLWESYKDGATMPHETVAVLCQHLSQCQGLFMFHHQSGAIMLACD